MRAQVICIRNGQTFRGVSRNLSLGGIQVEVPGLKADSTVQLTFRIPITEALVDAIGAVVWTVERRQGIRFERLGGYSGRSIRKFCAKTTR